MTGTMELSDVITATTDALTAIIPLATLAVLATAGVVIALATRFGGRIIRSLR